MRHEPAREVPVDPPLTAETAKTHPLAEAAHLLIELRRGLEDISISGGYSMWACDEHGCSSDEVREMLTEIVDEAHQLIASASCHHDEIDRLSDVYAQLKARQMAGYGQCTTETCYAYDFVDDQVDIARAALK